MSYAQDATSNLGRGFVSAAAKFDKERGLLDDTNAFYSCNGYGVRRNRSHYIYNLLTIVCSLEMGEVSRQIKLPKFLFHFSLFEPDTLTSKQEDDLILPIITFITRITIKI